MSGSRGYRWLALVPPLAILVGVPCVNGAQGYVLGLPPLLLWIVACVLFTSGTMAAIAALDHRRDARPAPDPAAHEPDERVEP